jgi:hypothetical protein
MTQRVCTLTAKDQQSNCPDCILKPICFAVRPLMRAGLWLRAIDLECAASGRRHSVKRKMVAAGLRCVEMTATAAGVALCWLTKLVLAGRRSGRFPGGRAKRTNASLIAVELRD